MRKLNRGARCYVANVRAQGIGDDLLGVLLPLAAARVSGHLETDGLAELRDDAAVPAGATC